MTMSLNQENSCRCAMDKKEITRWLPIENRIYQRLIEEIADEITDLIQERKRT